MLRSAGIHCEHVLDCAEARHRLERSSWDAVLTEASLSDGDWKAILACAFRLNYSPPVVVTHCAADDRLWAEALNLGCYDVLAQPFDTREVQRILHLACSQPAGRPPAPEVLPLRAFSAAS
jgi:DNA-binding NtrC family response regulator